MRIPHRHSPNRYSSTPSSLFAFTAHRQCASWTHPLLAPAPQAPAQLRAHPAPHYPAPPYPRAPTRALPPPRRLSHTRAPPSNHPTSSTASPSPPRRRRSRSAPGTQQAPSLGTLRCRCARRSSPPLTATRGNSNRTRRKMTTRWIGPRRRPPCARLDPSLRALQCRRRLTWRRRRMRRLGSRRYWSARISTRPNRLMRRA